jgi:hypothetical protein
MPTKRTKTDVELRLACIAAAAQHAPFNPEQVVTLASDYYRFVTGQTDRDVTKQVTKKLSVVSKS